MTDDERCPRFSYGGSLRTMICHSKVLKIENCQMPYNCPIKRVLKEEKVEECQTTS